MSAVCPCCGLAAPSSTVVGLTARQRQLLEYLEQRARIESSPTYGEMAHALDCRSKSDVHRLVVALEERGYIMRQPRRARSIIVLGSFPRRIAA